MNKATSKILSLLLAVCLMLGGLAVMPMTAYAAAATDITGGTQTISTPGLYDISTAEDGAVITVAADGIGLTGTHGNLTVVIGAGKTLTLKDAHITRTNGNPIWVDGAGCGIVLIGDNSGTSGNNAGVAVQGTSSLTITGPGKLTATGADGGAGIGGNRGASSGAITIESATIIAAGGNGSGNHGGGAGIGGGGGQANTSAGGTGNNITISNSNITAKGGSGLTADTASSGGGAGIGGGGGGSNHSGGAANAITINNSGVLATGGGGSGGGSGGSSGGGSGGGAGIGGGGAALTQSGGNGSNISIDSASSVQANGGNGGSGGDNGGGGGAAVGGGGATTGTAGTATNNTLNGGQLASGSSGGTGGTGSDSNGGAGALCGSGGKAGAAGATDSNNQSASSTPVDLASYPNTSDAGYPSFPTVTNPANESVTVGDGATFTVAASSGTAPYTYQWQLSTDSGVNWNDILGATTTSLTLTGVALTDSGKQYRCVVNDSVWYEAISNAATLTVNAADTTAPSISTLSPANGAQNVTTGAALTITFDEAVEIDSGDIKIFKASDTANPVYTITSPGALGMISPQSGVSASYTITPFSALDANTDYYITIDGTFFKDAAGNHFAGIADAVTWAFKTAAAPVQPMLTMATPTDDTATEGEVFSKTLSVTYTGSGTLGYSATGLPLGLSINTATGEISGTPDVGTSANSPYTVNVGVTDGSLSDSGSFTLTVDTTPVPAILTMATPTDDTATAGDLYRKTVSVTYTGNNSLTYGATGLPGSLSINTATGEISGLLTESNVGTHSITVTVSDGALPDASDSFTLTVQTAIVPQPVNHTVTFDLAGGTHTGGGALSQTVADGGAATAPTTTRSGYTFNGWDKSFSNVTADMTVTAQWTYNSTGNHDPINPPAPGVPIDTASDATFAFNGDYDDLAEIKLNNHLLTQTPDGAKKALSGYPGYAPVLGHAEAGSVKITLYKEFLKTLPNGVYSLTVSFSDGGEGELEFEIQQPTVNPVSSSSSRDSGSSSSNVADTIAAPAFKWYTQAELEAAIQNGPPARTRYSGSAGVKAGLWKLFGQSSYMHDTTADGAVQVRVQFTNPSPITTDVLLSGWVKGDAVNSIKGIFEKWFKNKVRVIHLEQQGSFGQPVQIAARVDLTGMDTENLYFYSYDKKANSYKRIEKPAYWIDKNGYLRFTTEYAGEIIISEGLLEKK